MPSSLLKNNEFFLFTVNGRIARSADMLSLQYISHLICQVPSAIPQIKAKDIGYTESTVLVIAAEFLFPIAEEKVIVLIDRNQEVVVNEVLKVGNGKVVRLENLKHSVIGDVPPAADLTQTFKEGINFGLLIEGGQLIAYFFFL